MKIETGASPRPSKRAAVGLRRRSAIGVTLAIARGRSAPRAHADQGLLLDARLVRGTAIELVAERVEGLVELLRAAVGVRVLADRDRRAVVVLEVLGIVVRALERGDLEDVALRRAEVDAVAEQLREMVLAAPQRR